MNEKTFILLISLLISSIGFTQNNDFNHQLGISAKASTNGFGGDIYYRPIKTFAIKAGAEYIGFNIKTNTLERYIGGSINFTIPIPGGDDLTFNSKGKFKTGALSLAVGYQPFKAFYLTAGVGKTLFAADVTGAPMSDLTFASHNIPGVGTVSPRISKENLYNFNITINPSNSIIPYVGIGLGSFVPQNKTFSIALEIGAYYVGNYVLQTYMPSGFNLKNIDYGTSISKEQLDQISDIIDSEINTVTSNLNTEINNVVNDINKKIESYKFYPVLKLTVGFRMLEFVK
ncbi:MAG TPA: hypothetical protein VLZ33_04180 [Dysgonamonadaceae bacterium]|nr:hypothetical protein [Dysgonamonadaceae bacterium]